MWWSSVIILEGQCLVRPTVYTVKRMAGVQSVFVCQCRRRVKEVEQFTHRTFMRNVQWTEYHIIIVLRNSKYPCCTQY